MDYQASLFVKKEMAEDFIREAKQRRLIQSRRSTPSRPRGFSDKAFLVVGKLLTRLGLSLQKNHGSAIDIPADYYPLLNTQK